MIKPVPAYCTPEIQDFPQKCQNPGFLGYGRQENLFLPPNFDYNIIIFINIILFRNLIFLKIYITL